VQLPAGLSIAGATGVISGTPTAVATNVTVTVTATDSATPTPQTATATVTFNITAAPPGPFTVTFNGNTGTPATSTATVTPPATTATMPPSPTRAGFTFNGWNTAADGSGTNFTAATQVTANITVFAQWTAVPPPPGQPSATFPPPATLTVPAGGSLEVTVATTNIPVGTPVTLGATPAPPAGVTMNPATVTNSVTITINTTAATPAGTHPLALVFGPPAAPIHTANFNLIVSAAATDYRVVITAGTSPMTIAPGATRQFTAEVRNIATGAVAVPARPITWVSSIDGGTTANTWINATTGLLTVPAATSIGTVIDIWADAADAEDDWAPLVVVGDVAIPGDPVTLTFNPQGGTWSDFTFGQWSPWGTPAGWGGHWANWNAPPHMGMGPNHWNPWGTTPGWGGHWGGWGQWHTPPGWATNNRSVVVARGNSVMNQFNTTIANHNDLGVVVRPGFIFQGWFVGTSNIPFNSHTVVNPAASITNVTLNARWTPAGPGFWPQPTWGAGLPFFTNIPGVTMPAEEPEQPALHDITLPTVQQPPTQLFNDVPLTVWFSPYVAAVSLAGIMPGFADGTFMPNVHTTRGMFAHAIYNMAGRPEVTGQPPFADVAPGAFYAEPAIWTNATGIIQGVGGNMFAPDTPVTREQMAVIIVNFALTAGVTLPQQQTIPFADTAAISPWAVSAVQTVQAAGIIQGRANGNFDPQSPATRAEVATILTRLLGVIG
ncbi:MAG: S-layer homology domain-containing protein, partial [Defluviitaleaceae bacterium]|nr:S-layer homology domain-containing protein [Defluviitaleaceae bacterium]